MSYASDPTLAIIGVADPGIPNKERILFRPRFGINLAHYMVGLGWSHPVDESFIPMRNRAFFFPNERPEEGSWVILYTGKGEHAQSHLPTSGEKTYSYFWGFEGVVFSVPQLVPVVFQFADWRAGDQSASQIAGYRPSTQSLPSPKKPAELF